MATVDRWLDTWAWVTSAGIILGIVGWLHWENRRWRHVTPDDGPVETEAGPIERELRRQGPRVTGEWLGWVVFTDDDDRETGDRARVRLIIGEKECEGDRWSARCDIRTPDGRPVTLEGDPRRSTHVTAGTDEHGPLWRVPRDHLGADGRWRVRESSRAEFL